MLDFESYVRERLGPLELDTEREAEIVEEIAEHMRAAYEEALEGGASERNALSHAESPFVPWDVLRKNIVGAETSADDAVPASHTVSEIPKRRWRGTAHMLANLWQDLGFGLRTFRKRPLFTAVAIGTLGLGIGATTTMFSVVDGVLLRPLPFARPAELVTVWRSQPGSDRAGALRWPEFVGFQESEHAFQEVAVHRPERLILTGSGEPASLVAGVATASLFPMLGVPPQVGRFFQEGEDGPGASQVAVLSGEIWQTRFGSDPSVIGQTITLDELPYEVIGVLPVGFRLRNRPGDSEIESGVDTGERDVWLPVGFDGSDVLAVTGEYRGRRYELWSRNLEFIGRLRSGVTLAEARAEADALIRSGESPTELEINLAPLKEEDTAGHRLPLLILLGAAGILSLVACSIVANLMVSEAIGRRHEMGTRVALGASRFNIARLVLTESLLLGLGGSLLGLVLATLGVRAAVTFGPYLPGLEHVGIDYPILIFAVSLGVLTSVVFGLAPAVKSARMSQVLLGGRGGGRAGRRLQHHLVAVVFALTTVLLVAGGLLTRSFWNLIQLDTGFRAENVATVRLPIIPERYEELAQRDAFLALVIEEMEAIPGVVQASGADNLPFPGARSGHPITLPGEEEGLETPLRRVLADYHEVMGIPLLEGRPFRATDVEGNQPVVILSEAAARHFWPGESAIGRFVNHGVYGDLMVVGVVGEVMEGWVERQARPMVYLPLAQTSQDEITLIARTAVNPTSILSQMREAVWAVDPDVAVAMETTMEALVADSNLSERYRTLLVMFFGVSATLLAAVGIFGVTARSVVVRTRELGIRVALGAEGQGLIRMVVRESLITSLAGTAIGLLGALWVSRLLSEFLFGVEPADPLTFSTVVSLLVVVCLVAGYLPSRKIVQLDPMTVLKTE